MNSSGKPSEQSGNSRNFRVKKCVFFNTRAKHREFWWCVKNIVQVLISADKRCFSLKFHFDKAESELLTIADLVMLLFHISECEQLHVVMRTATA